MFLRNLLGSSSATGGKTSSYHINRWDQVECSSCRSLSRQLGVFRTQQSQLHRQNAGTLRHLLHHSFEELNDCASHTGCVACQVFRRAFLLEQVAGCALASLPSAFVGMSILVALRSTGGIDRLELSISDGPSRLDATVALSTSNMPRSYPRVPSTDPLHPRRISQLRSWISRCHQDHLCANYAYSRRNPTWLINIQGNGFIRLVSGDDLGKDEGLVKYVALSYCWGDEKSINAAKSGSWNRVLRGHTTDVKERQLAFPITDLPETLQDAITITHAFDLQYVWIDSVCVPRGTWDNEADRMHEVYGNAHFTLTSSSTSNALDRILVERDAWRDASRGVRLHEPWLLNTDTPLDDVRTRSPVAARGWILQEERLSPRILYWCSQRAYWSCIECQRIEAAQPGGMRQHTAQISHPQKFMQLCRSGDLALLKSEWSDVVAAYSRRILSDVNLISNRYAAFSGLAVRYLSAGSGPREVDEYIAGLWRNNLAQNLAWNVKSGMVGTRSLQHAIPSWSWLSLPPGTDMEMATQLEESANFHLLTPSANPSDDTHRDIVRKGAVIQILHVSSHLRPLIADPNAAKVPWDGIERVGPRAGFDFSLDPAQPVFARDPTGRVLVYEAYREEIIAQLDYVTDNDGLDSSDAAVREGLEKELYCLEVGAQAMLLLQRVGDDDSQKFRRVGISLGYRKNFFEGAAVQQIEIL